MGMKQKKSQEVYVEVEKDDATLLKVSNADVTRNLKPLSHYAKGEMVGVVVWS